MSYLKFDKTNFLSVRNEDPGLAGGQNAENWAVVATLRNSFKFQREKLKNWAEYVGDGDFKKFQPQYENFGRSQLAHKAK